MICTRTKIAIGAMLAFASGLLTPAPTRASTILEYVAAQKETGGVDGLSGAQSIALSLEHPRVYVAAKAMTAPERKPPTPPLVTSRAGDRGRTGDVQLGKRRKGVGGRPRK